MPHRTAGSSTWRVSRRCEQSGPSKPWRGDGAPWSAGQHEGKVRTAAFTVHAGGVVDESEQPSQTKPPEEEAGHAH
ncbi:hypothetical protein [Streptomyces sp. AC550_RSS872]|uniref:hypothetical protein n=1 Tax=Streptomyces sp. AC550_RSS872 TaxID=2823689 RepID=UPI001C26D6F1|nr:hypothetical protein [Streptomyces sp. AC550_RSS872]